MPTIRERRTDDLEGLELNHDISVVFDNRTGARFAASKQILRLTPEHARAVAGVALRDMLYFGPTEGTLGEEKVGGLPTALSRVDYTIVNGKVRTYETEPRGAGVSAIMAMCSALGISKNENPMNLSLNHLEHIFGKRPISLLQPGYPPNDDSPVIEQRELNGNVDFDNPVIVRASPSTVLDTIGERLSETEQYHKLEALREKSIMPVTTDGLKRYRIARNNPLVYNPSRPHIYDPNNPPEPGSPFVFKPLQGTMSTGVGVYVPPTYAEGQYSAMGDSIRYGTAINRMNANPETIVEPFYPGFKVTSDGIATLGIFRVYVTMSYDPKKEEYAAKAVGGVALARKGNLIHGRSDAYVGLVVPEI